jgi:hypothetical protein
VTLIVPAVRSCSAFCSGERLELFELGSMVLIALGLVTRRAAVRKTVALPCHGVAQFITASKSAFDEEFL